MPMNEAMVITATSLWATCDSSWASTASSSRSSRLLFSRPVVTTRTEVFSFRPVANAFSIGEGATATRGLGMLASATRRSTMPCSRAARGSSSGLTTTAPAVLRAILSEYQKEPTPRARPTSTAMNTMPPLEMLVAAEDQHEDGDEGDEHDPEKKHRQGHPRRESPVRRIASLRHRAASVLSAGRGQLSSCRLRYRSHPVSLSGSGRAKFPRCAAPSGPDEPAGTAVACGPSSRPATWSSFPRGRLTRQCAPAS